MTRGTTPTHTFTIPFDTATIKTIRVIYTQDGTEICTKTEDDCTISKNEISTRLTQEDTLKFDSAKDVEIQIRILTQGNDALASRIIHTTCYACLSDEVLV